MSSATDDSDNVWSNEAHLFRILPPGIHPPGFVDQSLWILDSYRSWLKRDLVPRHGSAAEQAIRLFYSSQVVVSSGNEPDPLLNYGNRKALALWEMPWEQFRGLPGRLTAEPMERAARDDFLQRVRDNGFITDYQGIRISRSGHRFWISNATVWNILDASGNYLGQAATFNSRKNIPPTSIQAS